MKGFPPPPSIGSDHFWSGDARFAGNRRGREIRARNIPLASLIFLLACLSFTEVKPARAEALVTMLSTNAVEITSNYTGTEIAIFGAIERDAATVSRGTPYDIVISVKGPSVPLVVREKDRVGILWVNTGQRKFGEVPGFYAVLSSRNFNDILDEKSQQKLKIGRQAVIASVERSADDLPDFGTQGTPVSAFETALVRLRQSQGLYQEAPDAVVFQRANTFRAQVPLPANAPLGRYEVTTYLFSGSVLLARENAGFFVRKIGFEAVTAAAARTYPLLYGIAASIMALMVGWFASVIFRRD